MYTILKDQKIFQMYWFVSIYNKKSSNNGWE